MLPVCRDKAKVTIVGNVAKYCDIGVAISGPATPTLRYGWGGCCQGEWRAVAGGVVWGVGGSVEKELGVYVSG